MSPDISVVIPTFNRAPDLERTLRGIARTDRSNLDVELIIVDNNSSDRTRQVIESFRDCIRINYLFEERPGKNHALNRALRSANFGKIVVFADDDVDVEPNWLLAIAKSVDDWPEHSVFGGRIDIVWPSPHVPGWAEDDGIQQFGFTRHDKGTEAHVYAEDELPFGPNYWIRSEVLEGGRTFIESIGPHPSNRILGDETVFLQMLRRDGFEPVYVPDARVGHRIQPQILTEKGIRQRAWQMGRGLVHTIGLPQRELLEKRRWHWLLMRYRRRLDRLLACWAAHMDFDTNRRVRQVVYRRLELAFEVEALRVERARHAVAASGLWASSAD